MTIIHKHSNTGRRYSDANTVDRLVPLEVFPVKKGSRYRFRMNCPSLLFGFRVSIDGHLLHVVASDGHDVITRVVQSIIIFSGETYDFWIEASDQEEVGAYWIRAETLEHYHAGKVESTFTIYF